MKNRDVERLAEIHAFANRRWLEAVKKPSYPDNDGPKDPRTPVEQAALDSAEFWRRATRFVEDELMKDPVVRAGVIAGMPRAAPAPIQLPYHDPKEKPIRRSRRADPQDETEEAADPA